MKDIKPKYYLNKKLKPRGIGTVDTYPVYFRFTIGKNNHRIKSVLIGYLENEEGLEYYRREIELEILVLNYLYTRFHNYTFDRFSLDAYYLCCPLSGFISEYMVMNTDEFEDKVAMKVYMDELKAYIFSKTKLPLSFLDSTLDDINFESTLPSDFIKNKELKFIVDTYNYSFIFEENQSSIFCMYNWLHTDIKEEFSKLYGSSHSTYIDKIINLFREKINEPHSVWYQRKPIS